MVGLIFKDEVKGSIHEKTVSILMIIVVMGLMCTACGGNQDTEKIKITTENWQDYFELKPSATTYKDSKGEYVNGFTGAYVYLKKEYRDKIVSANVSFQWYLSEYIYCHFTHDLETGAISYSNGISVDTGKKEQDERGKLTFSYGKKSQNVYASIFRGTTATDSFSVDRKTASWDGYFWRNIEITKAQGTITISKQH